MLTGDLNVAVVEWIVQYQGQGSLQVPVQGPEPRQRRSARRSVDVSRHDEAVMRQVVGDHSVNEVLTVGREKTPGRRERAASTPVRSVRDRPRGAADRPAGREPPDPVKPAFNEVNQAIQEKERLINEAWADYNQTVPNARGEAERVVRAAEGYAPRAHQQRARRRCPLREHLRRVPQGAGCNAQAPLPRDPERRAAEDGRKLIIDSSMKGILPLLNLDPAKQEVK